MKILLADNQPNVRFALHVLLEWRPELIVVDEVADADELFARLAISNPQVLMLDWLLPGLSDSGSLPALRDVCPNLIIIVMSGRPELSQEALDAGADAFISKIDPPEKLWTTIERCQEQLNHKKLEPRER